MKIAYYVLLLCVIISLLPGKSCYGQQASRTFQRHQLDTAYFDNKVLAENFHWVDKQYLSAASLETLYLVALYNEAALNNTGIQPIKPVFTYSGDSITHVDFRKGERLISITKDTTVNGIAIVCRTQNEGTVHHVWAGEWLGGRREGVHFEYHNNRSLCLLINIYNKGKLQEHYEIRDCR